jgi:hypothetical protein
MSNYYLCNFLEIIDNRKIEKNDEIDNDVYIMHVKRYTIKTYNMLKGDVSHDNVYIQTFSGLSLYS